jgi:hypothetical protein
MLESLSYKAARIEAIAKLTVLGWFLFLCKEDKSPLTKNGHKSATLDAEQLVRALAKHPNALLAAPAGPNRGSLYWIWTATLRRVSTVLPG